MARGPAGAIHPPAAEAAKQWVTRPAAGLGAVVWGVTVIAAWVAADRARADARRREQGEAIHWREERRREDETLAPERAARHADAERLWVEYRHLPADQRAKIERIVRGSKGRQVRSPAVLESLAVHEWERGQSKVGVVGRLTRYFTVPVK